MVISSTKLDHWLFNIFIAVLITLCSSSRSSSSPASSRWPLAWWSSPGPASYQQFFPGPRYSQNSLSGRNSRAGARSQILLTDHQFILIRTSSKTETMVEKRDPECPLVLLAGSPVLFSYRHGRHDGGHTTGRGGTFDWWWYAILSRVKQITIPCRK